VVQQKSDKLTNWLNISTWQKKKATQQAGGRKQSNRWHKTKPKLEGYKMTKKPRKWTCVKLLGRGTTVIFLVFSFNI